jgi:hypothetical protein
VALEQGRLGRALKCSLSEEEVATLRDSTALLLTKQIEAEDGVVLAKDDHS